MILRAKPTTFSQLSSLGLPPSGLDHVSTSPKFVAFPSKDLKNGSFKGTVGGSTFLKSVYPTTHFRLHCSTDAPSTVKGLVVDTEKHITRILFCGPYFPACEGYTKEYLQHYPFVQVDDVPLADVPDVIANYDICVVKNMRLDSNIISRAERLKLIMQFGVGLDGVDIEAASKRGIKVAKIPGDITGNAASCAEMAVYLILGLLKKQTEMQAAIKQRKLGEPVGDTLLGKTVFIMGLGTIGTELAKRLRPFGVKIIATKRSWAVNSQFPEESNGLSIQNAAISDLVDEKGSHEDIYNFASKADIVFCCLSMNKETVSLVNKSFISSMKKGSLLVNIARGGLLDYKAVMHYLQSGHLGGLAIDVAWAEPFDPIDPILKFDNVLVTPHVAGATEHCYRYRAKVLGDVALQLHAGIPLEGIEIVN